MKIRVQSVSASIYERLSSGEQLGEVHSLFARSGNIFLSDDARLITLVLPEAGNLPYGILLAKEAGDDLRQLNWQVGDEVLINPADGITVRRCDLRFSFDGASTWARTFRQTIGSSPDCIARIGPNLSWSYQYLLAHSRPDGMVPLLPVLISKDNGKQELSAFNRGGYVLLKQLREGLQSKRPVWVCKQVNRLLGLGIGLTPSADDILTGMLAAFQIIEPADPRRFLADTLSAAVGQLLSPNVTTRVSYTQLWYACRGQFSEKTNALIEALLAKHDPELLADRLNWMMSLGATSGAETTMGILLGFDIFLHQSKKASSEIPVTYGDFSNDDQYD